MTKLLSLLVGISLGATILGIVLGLVGSLLAVGFLGLTLIFRRDWVPTIYNVRSLTVRKVTTGLTALGLALVVFVFTTVLMLGAGIDRTMASTGLSGNVKVIRKGAQTEIQSGIQPEHVRLLSAAAEVATAKDGQPLASPELTVLIFAQKADAKSDEEGANVTVRGVGPHALELHPEVGVDGRLFKPGTSEILLGRGLVGKFKGFELGGQAHFARRDWMVVGIIDGHGSAFDSEVWGDVEQFEDAFNRRPSMSSLTLKLKDKSQFAAFKAHLEDPQLNSLEAKPEIEYWEDQSKTFSGFIKALGLFVAVIFAFGAALGAMITMYAQVAARTREIGVLRALGFRRRSVLVSFVAESVVLGLASGAVGIACASFMRYASFSTMNFQSFSETNFQFYLTPGIALAGFIFSAVLGYAGGLLPAVRAARMPIVQATRG